MRFALPCVVLAVCVVVELLHPARIQPPQSPEDPPGAAIMDAPEPLNIVVLQDEFSSRELEYWRKSNEPFFRDLANGRFTGGKMTDLLAAYPPDLLLTHGDYTTAVYAEVRGHLQGSYGSTCVIALKGRLVRAHGSSCIWHTIFFNGLSEKQREEWWGSYDAAYRRHFNLPPRPPAPPAPAPAK